MKGESRKAVLAAWRERKVRAGIYAVRCLVTGENWVGQAGDLDAIANRLWFTLRQGGCLDRGLQAAWNNHGADGFQLDILEVLDSEEPATTRTSILSDRLTYWQAELSARVI